MYILDITIRMYIFAVPNISRVYPTSRGAVNALNKMGFFYAHSQNM